MKIMLVDDSGTMRAIQKKILQDMGITDIVEASDGNLALKALETTKVDLILLDWNMPNLPGIDTLKQLKVTPALKDIPVIMVTSEAEKTRVMEAVAMGAANYIVKPFAAEVLKLKLTPYMGKANG